MMRLISRIKHFHKNVQILHIFFTKFHLLNFTFKKELYKLFQDDPQLSNSLYFIFCA